MQYQFRTKKSLAALCVERGIKVAGDKRKLETYVVALEKADKIIEPLAKLVKEVKKNTLIDNNCDFGDRINHGTIYEKRWLVQKDGHGASLVFQKQGDFYITYAGDACRAIEKMQFPAGSEKGVLTTGFPAHALERYSALANQLKLSIFVFG
jgi:MutS domain I